MRKAVDLFWLTLATAGALVVSAAILSTAFRYGSVTRFLLFCPLSVQKGFKNT
jgi:hypothetical protein